MVKDKVCGNPLGVNVLVCSIGVSLENFALRCILYRVFDVGDSVRDILFGGRLSLRLAVAPHPFSELDAVILHR